MNLTVIKGASVPPRVILEGGWEGESKLILYLLTIHVGKECNKRIEKVSKSNAALVQKTFV